jgi:hypothetical protein
VARRIDGRLLDRFTLDLVRSFAIDQDTEPVGAVREETAFPPRIGVTPERGGLDRQRVNACGDPNLYIPKKATVGVPCDSHDLPLLLPS